MLRDAPNTGKRRRRRETLDGARFEKEEEKVDRSACELFVYALLHATIADCVNNANTPHFYPNIVVEVAELVSPPHPVPLARAYSTHHGASEWTLRSSRNNAW